MCRQERETVCHILWDCLLLIMCGPWSKDRFRKAMPTPQIFFPLTWSIMERLPIEEMELWAVLAWAIWNARNKICFWGQSSSTWSLQKRLLFAMKLFRRLQKTIGKTSFFNSKSLSSTITHQILKHLWGKMSLSKIPITFV